MQIQERKIFITINNFQHNNTILVKSTQNNYNNKSETNQIYNITRNVSEPSSIIFTLLSNLND